MGAAVRRGSREVATEVAGLDGVGHGTTLGGRYRLEQPLHIAEGTEVWRALDTVLGRPVGVRFVTGPVVEDALDAARRAALVEDPRLLRVLDVGTETVEDAAEVSYVISEFVEGESLATRLQRGPERASVVRAVIGEAAEALERARAAGLHHACLTPAALVLTPDDGVKVAGLAVDATLHPAGAAGVSGDDAARADALGLVALLYAGLTARWPGGAVDGVPAAPELSGHPVPPADLVPGVPNDLDTLCAVTLGPHDDGPRTPGELAEQLAPWGRRPVEVAEAGTAEEGMRPPTRFPVRLAGTVGAVGAAATAAATAAGIRREPDPAAGGGSTLFDDTRATFDDTGATGRPATEPPVTALPAAPDPEPAAAAPRTGLRTQSAVVIAVFAALVVLGLVLAVNSLTGIGSGTPDAAAPAQPTEPAVAEPEPEPEPEGEPGEPEAPAQPPPQIQGVRTLDPQGDDGVENDEQAPLAIDGDPGTAWTSSTYASPEFGNLKDGVGMVVDLGRPSALSGVTLQVNGTGGAVEVRAAPGPDLEGSQVVGAAEITGEPVDVALPEPVETQHVILWFTRVPDVGGDNRIELAEVQVR